MNKAIGSHLNTIRAARGSEDFADVGRLFREYANWLNIDENFPDLEAEIATLPGQYAPPAGELILAEDSSGSVIGCVAIRPHDGAAHCAMKRLYVQQSSRSKGAGRALAEAAVAFARTAGYQSILLDTLPSSILLDTLPSMVAAITIYRFLGFNETAAYYASPGPGALYFQKFLNSAQSSTNQNAPRDYSR